MMLPADRPRCYVASPLGFTEAGRHYYATVFLPALATAVEPVDPWALTTDEDIAVARAAGGERAAALQIGRRNAAAIKSCVMLAAYLEGQEPDCGTVAEIGFAAALGLTCFGLCTDSRQAGEAGVSVNLQVETFIVDSGGMIAASLDELVRGLRASATP